MGCPLYGMAGLFFGSMFIFPLNVVVRWLGALEDQPGQRFVVTRAKIAFTVLLTSCWWAGRTFTVKPGFFQPR